MLKTWAGAGLGAGMLLSLSAFGAQALPVAGDLGRGAAPMIETVADGCGPGFFRGRRGICRPMGGGPRAYGPPPRRFYGGPRGYGPRGYGGPGFYGPRPGPRGFYRDY